MATSFPLKNFSAAFTFLKVMFIFHYLLLHKPFIVGVNGTEAPESPTEISHPTVALCFKLRYL